MATVYFHKLRHARLLRKEQLPMTMSPRACTDNFRNDACIDSSFQLCSASQSMSKIYRPAWWQSWSTRCYDEYRVHGAAALWSVAAFWLILAIFRPDRYATLSTLLKAYQPRLCQKQFLLFVYCRYNAEECHWYITLWTLLADRFVYSTFCHQGIGLRIWTAR